MAQTYTDNCFDGDHAAQSDMANIENNFAALKSSFSGASSPSNVVGGQIWQDNPARKVRNYANTQWLASLIGDANFKIPVYRNNTCDGWNIDTSVIDRVIAIKGGSQAYNVNGGTLAGTWTQPNHTHGAGSYYMPSHNHRWYNSGGPSNDDKYYNSDGTAITLDGAGIDHSITYDCIRLQTATDDNGMPDAYTTKTTDSITGTSNGGASANTWRPAAAVCTLQYPDLS